MNRSQHHSFRPITEDDVRDFFTWRYEPPYQVYTYDDDPSAADLAYYLDPRYQIYGMVDESGALVAFCSFGEDGHVPGGDYSATALDIGLGLRPDLTGQGRGSEYVQCVIDFACTTFAPQALRVTIAEFNVRAQKVWQRLGFVEVSRFGRESDGRPFIVYMNKKPFVPAAFPVPLRIVTADFILRKLTTADVKQDYDAVISSRVNLRQIFAEADDWPAETMTLQDNYRDLERHQTEFDAREGFTYTLVTPAEDRCIGCVYIYPCQRGAYDVQVYYWVRDSVKVDGMDERLGAFLHQWLDAAWPFEHPAFPGRTIPWDAWERLKPA